MHFNWKLILPWTRSAVYIEPVPQEVGGGLQACGYSSKHSSQMAVVKCKLWKMYNDTM